jgi:hypothetical protein
VYRDRVPALARAGPFVSKDIDFCGDQKSVRLRARRLCGRAYLATFDCDPEHRDGCVLDDAGVKRTLDILLALFALSARHVERRHAVPQS